MATAKREGKERRGLSPPAPSGKVPAAEAARSSSSGDKEASSRPKRNNPKPTATATPDPCRSGKKTLPQASATDGGTRLTRNKSMERVPSAPHSSRNPAVDGVKNKAFRSSSSLPRGVGVVDGTSPRPKQGGIPAAAAKSPRPKPGGVPAVAATSPRPRSGATVAVTAAPKPKADRPIKHHGKVPTSPASKHTVKKDSSSRSSPIPETKPEAEMVAVPVAKVTQEKAVAKVDDEVEEQCPLDSTHPEDEPVPHVPDPEREIIVIAKVEEERSVETEVDVDAVVEHHEPEEQRSDDVGKEEEAAQSVVKKERPVVARKEAKEMIAYNDVIEETRSKLVEKKKGKVLALVGAFETVISLQETETPTPAQAPAQVNRSGDNTTDAIATTSVIETTSAAASDPGRGEAERDDGAMEQIEAAASGGANEPIAATATDSAYEPIAATVTVDPNEPIMAIATDSFNEPIATTTTNGATEAVAATRTDSADEPIAATATNVPNEAIEATATNSADGPILASATGGADEPIAASAT